MLVRHLSLAAVRAVENGVPLVRAATSGISALVDARGRLVWTLPVGQPAVRVADVSLPATPSTYAQVGDVFAWACVSICLLAAAPRRR